MPDIPHSAATLTIDRLGGLGDGLATHEGRRVLVPKSAPGDVLEVTLRDTGSEALHADILRIITPGPDRADTPCPHYATCGSCTLQHLREDAYRTFKTTTLREAIRKAGYPPPAEPEMHFLPHATRRRADFKITRDGALGYLRLKSHDIAAVSSCMILSPRLQAFLPTLHQALKQSSNIPITGIQITDTDSGIDALLKPAHTLSKTERENLTALSDSLNAARVCLLEEHTLTILREYTPVMVSIGTHCVPVPPGAFLQASREGQDALTCAVLHASAGSASALDLFCGIGTYAVPLAAAGIKVHAVEGDTAMTSSLSAHAQATRLPLTAERRDLLRNALRADLLNRYDTVVINPPRAGARLQAERLAESRVKRIVMVSCNPATFARDAALLREGGYRLERAQGIDQFVWSAHLEIVAVLTR